MKTTRRRFLKAFGFESLGVWVTGRSAIWPDGDGPLEYLNNPALTTIKPGFKGNAMRDGQFLNLDMQTSLLPFSTIFKWFLTPNPQREEKKNDPFRVTVRPMDGFPDGTNDGLIWLGHSTFLIGIGGRWIVTDPCLTQPPMQKRFAELPLPIEALDRVDYILQSHNHFDHLDSDTVGEWKKPKTALVPLRLGDTMRDLNKYVKPQEAGWYQTFSLNENFKIHCLPAHHWSQRRIGDRNHTLWASCLIEWGGKKLYFAGDSNYSDHFQEIGELFGPIDVCLMPIGAYKPEHIMKGNHTNPEEAVQAFHDLGGKTFIPMHYGTFDLADEPRGEPLRWLRRLESDGRIHGTLKVPDIGEFVAL